MYKFATAGCQDDRLKLNDFTFLNYAEHRLKYRQFCKNKKSRVQGSAFREMILSINKKK